MNITPTEHQIQTQIIQYLRFKGLFVLRLNSGAMRMQSKGKEYLMRMSPAGTPDIMAFNSCPCCAENAGAHIYFIEVKRSKKDKPTALQLAKMDELREFGAVCFVASSVDDLKEYG